MQWRKSNRMHFIFIIPAIIFVIIFCLSRSLFGMVFVAWRAFIWRWHFGVEFYVISHLCVRVCVCAFFMHAFSGTGSQSLRLYSSCYSALQWMVNWKPLPIYRNIQMIFQSPLYSIPIFFLCSLPFLNNANEFGAAFFHYLFKREWKRQKRKHERDLWIFSSLRYKKSGEKA